MADRNVGAVVSMSLRIALGLAVATAVGTLGIRAAGQVLTNSLYFFWLAFVPPGLAGATMAFVIALLTEGRVRRPLVYTMTLAMGGTPVYAIFMTGGLGIFTVPVAVPAMMALCYSCLTGKDMDRRSAYVCIVGAVLMLLASVWFLMILILASEERVISRGSFSGAQLTLALSAYAFAFACIGTALLWTDTGTSGGEGQIRDTAPPPAS